MINDVSPAHCNSYTWCLNWKQFYWNTKPHTQPVSNSWRTKINTVLANNWVWDLRAYIDHSSKSSTEGGQIGNILYAMLVWVALKMWYQTHWCFGQGLKVLMRWQKKAGDDTWNSNAGTTDSIRFCCQWANKHTHTKAGRYKDILNRTGIPHPSSANAY